MAVSHGYSKITTSGSVFAYDTGDVVNSWKGKPGTNVSYGIVNLQGTNTGQYFKTSYGNEVDNIPGLGGNTTVRYIDIFNDYPSSGACCVQLFAYASDTPISGSTTYTYQLVYKTLGGENSNFLYRYEYNAAGAYVTEGGVWSASNIQDLGNGWSHAWGQFTTNASTTKIYLYTFYYEYNTWRHIQVAGVSVTQGTTIYPPRQFIPTASSRALTQGLIDLSGYNKVLDLSAMSFTSTGQITFDGTDDFISIPNSTSYGNFTAEVVIKPTSNPGNAASAISTEYPGSNSTVNFAIGFNGSQFFGGFFNASSGGWHQINTTIPTLNVYAHYVLTYNGTQMVFYKNGIVLGTMDTTDIAAGGNPIRIGRRWDLPDYFPGNIDIARVYDRALTQGEVTDNFNHYKTRFNIT